MKPDGPKGSLDAWGLDSWGFGYSGTHVFGSSRKAHAVEDLSDSGIKVQGIGSGKYRHGQMRSSTSLTRADMTESLDEAWVGSVRRDAHV